MSKIILSEGFSTKYFTSPAYDFKAAKEVPQKPDSVCQNRGFSLDKRDILRQWLLRNTFSTNLEWFATADDNMVNGLIFGGGSLCEIKETTRYESWTDELKGPYQRIVQIKQMPADSFKLPTPLDDALSKLGYGQMPRNFELKAAKNDGKGLPKTTLERYFLASEKL